MTSTPPQAPDFRTLFEASPNAYLVLTPGLIIVAATDAYLRITQTRREAILGRHLFDAFPDNPRDPMANGVSNLRASLMHVLATGVPDAMAVQRYDIARPDPSDGGDFDVRYWSPHNSPVFDGDGTLRYVIHRVEDVTAFIHQKQQAAEESQQHAELQVRAGEMEGEIFQRAQQIQEANQQLRTANEQLGELDRLKSEFFANVSHEFRTPLTLMLGPTEDLLAGRAGALSDEARKELERVHRNARRLLKLVNALLDLSRLEAGPKEERFVPADLAALTTDAASSFRSAMERAGLKLTVDCPRVSAPVYVAPDLWEQIVLNLVSNAFKFTLQGGVTLRLREHGRWVSLEVEDTGSGIPAPELPRLFERFHRVPGTASRTHEGTGIGLALVQEFARLHGGTVGVNSQEGQGTTFTVTLPLGHAHLPPERIRATPHPRSAAREATTAYVQEALQWSPNPPKELTQSSRAPAPSQETPAREALPRARILLADDNRDMRDYIQRVLSTDYEVEAVKDGQKALEAALENPPDLVLSDVMMPRLDGVGLLRALRAAPRTRELPILLLSAKAGEQATVEGLTSGADDYLVKPFSAGELLARIASNLKLARMRREVADERARSEGLSEALRGRDDFLSVAAHELRTPLTAFQLHLDLVERGLGKDAPPKVLERLKQARAFIRRLAALVEVLMDVSQITSGRLKLARTDVDLAELLVEVTRFAEEEARRDGTQLTVTVHGPVTGAFDPSRISQVVHNLVSNALKFGRGRPVDVTLRQDGEWVRLCVADRGIGIRPEDRERIFGRFERAVSTHHYGGLGLGLWVSRQVVEAHQGRIDVEDTPGGGTTFRVTLPVKEAPSPAAAALSG
ncbi:ATP-binding protein [Corallococcus sicarius]|uniref:histidine kinase n=1 Tax=Corallococcus sicarius TaxID=2316726 RepID=A0A3A8MTL7_9BACT|nr:ATP-binding protein [Corallococcus sicarius]RKH32085.1 response regulator [Corallococcus sicarius]